MGTDQATASLRKTAARLLSAGPPRPSRRSRPRPSCRSRRPARVQTARPPAACSPSPGPSSSPRVSLWILGTALTGVGLDLSPEALHGDRTGRCGRAAPQFRPTCTFSCLSLRSLASPQLRYDSTRSSRSLRSRLNTKPVLYVREFRAPSVVETVIRYTTLRFWLANVFDMSNAQLSLFNSY